MLKDQKTIAEGRDSIESTNDIAVIREMGNRLCGTYQSSGKNERALHHHHAGVPDMMGGSAAGQRLHDCYSYEVFI